VRWVLRLPIVFLAATPSLVGQAPDPEEQVRRLLARPDIREAFAVIEELEPRSHADLVRLTEIPAPPFQEAVRAEAFAGLLRDAGADSVWTDAEGNVLALRRGVGGGGAVALAGHLDTVFPEGTDVTVRMRGDTLFAPGVGDDARGLVVVLTVLRALEAADIRTPADLLFIGTVGEEGLGNLRGVRHLFRDGGRPLDAFIAVDGGGYERVTNQAVGSVRYRVTFEGPGGHSWGAFGLANPHHALGRAIDRFAAAADEYTRQGERTSFNVGRIGGGTSINSIPFASWMEVDMRSLSPERLDGIDAVFRTAIQEALEAENAKRRQGPALTASVDRVGLRPSGTTSPEAPLVRRAVAATRLLGGNPELNAGSTDANIPISLGVPAVTIGRGGVGGANHSLDEWWLNQNGDLAIKKALLVLVAEAGEGNDGT
jgi:acetylornithine deacetylase/succinyl-diaminopimelate desuccinylase-like protein